MRISPCKYIEIKHIVLFVCMRTSLVMHRYPCANSDGCFRRKHERGVERLNKGLDFGFTTAVNIS
jgi:hypothetical protein